MSQLLNIYLDPAKAFAELKEKPGFWLPLLLQVALVVILMLSYFNSVDSAWFTDYQAQQAEAQMQRMGVELSPADLERMRKQSMDARTSGYFAAAFTPIMLLIVYLLFALYYLLASKVTGNAMSFKQSLTLSIWAGVPFALGMPGVIGMAVALVGVLTMSPQTGLESLMFTHLDPLLLQLPVDHAWTGFARAFDLLLFWAIFLAALGWRSWNRCSWTQAIVVVALPSVVIFGIWALIAAL